ncbi:Glycoside hydrolase family 28 protein [Rubrivivax sp. A210]|uniref:glycoside hydrolase family 28 protein n=1 Tax=Rubrivivax sp. A210 TaxID=2772301 RepID=UPI001919985C|nr:glycoside hydrolase family 28 protein [Rubrivivax sp. A210]CAD5373495.1 Glycoside hydrolase family 28 protein [Rubrivivax sp. A210]
MTLPSDDQAARRRFLGLALGASTGLLLSPLLAAASDGEDAFEGAHHAHDQEVERPTRGVDAEVLAWTRTVPRILSRIRAPRFPRRDFLITDFGAIAGDRVADPVVVANTQAIAAAIAACNAAGGGRVVVPRGTFMTGAIRLLSHVNLHLPLPDSVLLFDTDPRKYPNVLTRWEGNDLYNYSPLVYAFRETHIAITGQGRLDGQAGIDQFDPNNRQGNPSAWWWWKGGSQSNPQFGCASGTSTFPASTGYPCLPNQSADSLLLKKQGAVPGNVPMSQRVYGIDASNNQHYLRPPLIGPYGCENVLIEGVTLNRSPFWQLHPLFCKNVTVRGVTMSSRGTNNDGCNPEGCVDVLIENCSFDTGDDCIAIKAGRGTDAFAPPPGMPAEAIAPWVVYPNHPAVCSSSGDTRACAAATRNIVIRNCVMASGHGGVTLGSEMSGGIENVFAENIQMNSSELDIALRFKTNTRRGGVMRNYFARNIQVPNGVSANNGAITIDYFYRADSSDDPAEAGPYRPFTDQIYISNLTVGRGTKAGTKAFNIRGFGTGSPLPLPPNFVANTPRAGVAGSVGVNDAIGVVRVKDSTFNVSTTPDVVQNVDLRLVNVTINRT